MGEVWRARHVELDAARALKRTLRKDAPLAARFEREARALARVRHPSVVVVHEVGREPDGTAWLAMELLEGEPLDQALARGPLPLARALDVGARLARGLEALHAAGVVHRDLKPANVVLQPDGRAVLLDLGVALAGDERERLTRSGVLVGTPAYMAPEQLAAGEVGPPADVHALGLVLFELLTGRCAREGDLAALVRGRAERPSTVDPRVPADVDDLVAAATATEPARRPTASALAARLEALARRPGGTARARRRASWAAAGAACAALLAGALVVRRGGPAPAAPRPAAPTPAVPAAPTPAAPTPAPKDEALAAARRLAPAARRDALVAWLAAHADDPARGEAEALLAPLLRDAPRWRLLRPRKTPARFVGPDRVAVGLGTGVELVDASSGAVRGVVPAEGALEDLAALPGGRAVLVATAGPSGLVVLDLEARTATRLPWDPALRPERVVVDREGARALVLVDDDEPVLVALPGGERLARLEPHGAPVRCVAFGPGQLVLTGSGRTSEAGVDNALRVWSSPDGSLLRRVGTASRANGLAVVPGTDRLLVGTSGGQLLWLDAVTGEPRGPLVGADVGGGQRAHAAGVRQVVCLPGGRLAVSAAGDPAGSGPTDRSDLAVWDLERGALVRRLPRPRAPGGPCTTVSSLDLDPTGRALLLVDEGGAVERWDVGPLVGE